MSELFFVLSGGSLADIIEERRSSGKTFSEEELKVILYQIAKGLKYIHSQNLVHLDIKPGMFTTNVNSVQVKH